MDCAFYSSQLDGSNLKKSHDTFVARVLEGRRMVAQYTDKYYRRRLELYDILKGGSRNMGEDVHPPEDDEPFLSVIKEIYGMIERHHENPNVIFADFMAFPGYIEDQSILDRTEAFNHLEELFSRQSIDELNLLIEERLSRSREDLLGLFLKYVLAKKFGTYEEAGSTALTFVEAVLHSKDLPEEFVGPLVFEPAEGLPIFGGNDPEHRALLRARSQTGLMQGEVSLVKTLLSLER
jgi:hypothetical protein